MGECYSEKFICNNEVESCEEFSNDFVNKGKSLYEVIRIIKGVPLFLEDHLQRLENSASITGLELWLNKSEIKSNIEELCRVNNVFEGNVKIVFNHRDENEKDFLMYFIKHNYPTEDMYKNGVYTTLYHAERENPNAKVINTNLREATNKIIKEKGVFEAILVDDNGYITEGSRSTIFMIKGNKIFTSPLKAVLPGITRKYVVKVCNELGKEIEEKEIYYKDIKELDGLFVCGTSPKVLPISRVDENKYNPNNDIVQQIKKGYDKVIQEYVENN
ncbi:aminotransferase class IV [Clostridium ganghwense]|uniref:Aminotransferase class IV n=1 Tax=Clostridium ganghwense TaxID=312089 RepID=A0ABT4CQT0_9CLOT|nr:aminotransferase class IV [Clostridium ganghwense]MCY6370441.1 aminotransferase class IV [Clostridium ganghwense]